MQDKKVLTLNDFLPELRTPDIIKTELRDRFIARRKELKLSRERLSQRSGINVGVIRRYEENGYIALDNLIYLAYAMDLANEFDKLFPKPKIKRIYE